VDEVNPVPRSRNQAPAKAAGQESKNKTDANAKRMVVMALSGLTMGREA
tara:strand:- start:304 stop:450 length:147 start_codon:yes stop_codon:yes gene_type:complete